jgi:hypothetical protein
MKGTQNLTNLVVFGIGLMLKANDILADKRVTLAEGIDATLYVGTRLPNVLRSAKDAVLEFKDLDKTELVALKDRVVRDIRIDGVAPTNERAIWIVSNALEVAISAYNFADSFKGEIPQGFSDVDTLYNSIVGTTYIDTITT